MTDLDELFGPEAWGPIQGQLRRREDPQISDIARALRGKRPVPEVVRLYIANYLEGKIKRKRGRKTDKSAKKEIRDILVVHEVNRWIEVCRRAKRCGIPIQGGNHAAACEKASKTTSVPESTVDKIYYARTKGKKKASS